jgi:murein DD-endopeptidase MepM/ murein hydrolase activator NlpD
MRRLSVIAMVSAGLLCPALPGAVAHADGTAAEQNAKAIADAQDEVTAAAQAIADAGEKLEMINGDLGTLQTDIAALEATTNALRTQMEDMAVRRFTGATHSNMPLLSSWGTPEQQMQVDAFTSVIVENADQAFDTFDSTNRDLAAKHKSLERMQQQIQRQTVDLAALQKRAEEKVVHLKQVEKQRLKDEATRRALEREQARRAKKAAAQAAASVGSKPAAHASPAAAPAAAGGHVASTAGGGQANISVGSTKLYGTYVQGGAAAQGVQLGNGIGYPDLPFGSPGFPTTSGVDWSGTDWVCPTGRARTGFGHSFIPKTSPNQTRYHNGIDMSARLGTPLLAVEDGVAMPKIMPLTGGMTVFLVTASGTMYYYAHLEVWGQMGRVQKGTVIGYAGSTGHASGPHLHFEYHPNGIGTDAVDPYDLLRAHC